MKNLFLYETENITDYNDYIQHCIQPLEIFFTLVINTV